jgi:putative DNA primase/helicase
MLKIEFENEACFEQVLPFGDGNQEPVEEQSAGLLNENEACFEQVLPFGDGNQELVEEQSAGLLTREMTEKVSELETQRKLREEQMVEVVLRQISDAVATRETDIIAMMTGKTNWQNDVREVVLREILAKADGRLWCREYIERLRSDQRVMIYTGTHWEVVELQLWKDFIGRCAQRCGVPESLRMNPTFMRPLYEQVAFNVAECRKQQVPENEVWLNMRNGTLVVRKDGSASLRDHRKEDLFTYTLPYDFDPRAESPLWQKFLDRVLPEKACQMVLGEYLGYILMKSHALEKMLWLFGSGQNGKSVTLEVIEALLGSQNVSYLSLSDLTNDDVKRAGIEHKMLNISHESGKDVNTNVLKELTSGERVTIKHLYVDPRETKDYGKFIAAFNELPRAENTYGFFRRIIIVPYEVTIPREEVDLQLTTKLKQELSAILNWVLEGLVRLMNQGAFTHSESSEQALERYRLQSDSVRLFLDEQCEASDIITKAVSIYNTYRYFCTMASLKPLGRNRFYDRLEGLGFVRKKIQREQYFLLKINEV